MPINNVTGLPGNQPQRTQDGAQVQVNRSEPEAEKQETGRPSTVDTVSLTDTSERLRNLENTLANLPVVDTQRVEAIQQAIAEGSFEINAEKIAEKMLQFDTDLG
jgi:negative regulator of flagellin synthesis FlgM